MLTDPNHPRPLKSAFHLMAILLFFAAILLPAAGHISGRFDVNYIRETEKRNPNEPPDFPDSLEKLKSYPGQLNAYLNDHFGFRSWLVSMNSMMLLKTGSSASPKVIAGRDGWLFYTAEHMVEQYRGIKLFTNKESRRWVEAMEERKAWLGKKGIPFIIAVPPNKMTIYSEFLPNWVTKTGTMTQLDQIVSAMKGSSLDFIDLRKPMLSAKQKCPVYYKTDSHWNFHGAFAGYRKIVERVKKFFPNIQPLSLDDVDISYFAGQGMDLSNMLNISKLTEEPHADRSSLKRASIVTSVKQAGENYFPQIVKTKAIGLPKVLIFRDSFTFNLEPFFNETFGEIIYVENDFMRFNPLLIEKFHPDLVLQVFVERGLAYKPYNPSGVSDGKLRIVNWGPTRVQDGKKFNVVNNMSALWIIGENISDKTHIVWSGKTLETVRDLKRDTLSALVPDDYYAEPGKYEIKLFDSGSNVYSDSVFIAVEN